MAANRNRFRGADKKLNSVWTSTRCAPFRPGVPLRHRLLCLPRNVKRPSPQKLLSGVFSPSKVSRLQMKLKAADEAHRGKPIWLAENSGPDKACPSLSTFSHAPIPLCCLHQNSISNHFVSEVDIWPATVPLPLATSYPRDIDNRHRMRGPYAEDATMITPHCLYHPRLPTISRSGLYVSSKDPTPNIDP